MGDLGIAGPDHGAGGRYLLVPPGTRASGSHGGVRPDDPLAHVSEWFVLRAFMGPGGDTAPGDRDAPQTRIYSLAAGRRPAGDEPRRGTGRSFDTIHPTDIRYFEDLAEMVEYEPYDAISLEESAELAQIGIEKGKPFAPDERMRAILDEAAQVGSFMAFAITNAPRDEYRRYPDRQW